MTKNENFEYLTDHFKEHNVFFWGRNYINVNKDTGTTYMWIPAVLPNIEKTDKTNLKFVPLFVSSNCQFDSKKSLWFRLDK